MSSLKKILDGFEQSVQNQDHVVYISKDMESPFDILPGITEEVEHCARSSAVSLLEFNSDNSRTALAVLLPGALPQDNAHLEQFWRNNIPVCSLCGVSEADATSIDWTEELKEFKGKILRIPVWSNNHSNLTELLRIVCKNASI